MISQFKVCIFSTHARNYGMECHHLHLMITSNECQVRWLAYHAHTHWSYSIFFLQGTNTSPNSTVYRYHYAPQLYFNTGRHAHLTNMWQFMQACHCCILGDRTLDKILHTNTDSKQLVTACFTSNFHKMSQLQLWFHFLPVYMSAQVQSIMKNMIHK